MDMFLLQTFLARYMFLEFKFKVKTNDSGLPTDFLSACNTKQVTRQLDFGCTCDFTQSVAGSSLLQQEG